MKITKVHLVLDKAYGYALFYTDLNEAKIVKSKLEEEGGQVTITTFNADLNFKQIINAYHRSSFDKISDSKLKEVLKPHYIVSID